VKKNQPQVYQEWLRMVMKQKNWWVIVTTDRGLYAPWFYQAIQQLGWHPFMRINHQGYYRCGDRLKI
jgi:hypothetical protein